MTVSLQAPSLVRRMACWVYEGVLLFGVVFIAGYLLMIYNVWMTISSGEAAQADAQPSLQPAE